MTDGVKVAPFLRSLRGPERNSAIRGSVDAFYVYRKLRTTGLRSLITSPRPRATTPDVLRSIKVATAIDAGLGLIPASPTCLRRSVVLIRELHRLGLVATMHIGVRTRQSQFEAHAWVQVGDVVVNDDPTLVTTYTELNVEQIGQLPEGLR